MAAAGGFALILDDGPEPGQRTSAIRAFGLFLLIHGAVRSWLWLHFAPEQQGPALGLAAGVITLALALACHPATRPQAARLALPALLLQLYVTFPSTDNHFAVELLAMALLGLHSDGPDDDVLVLASLRWLCVIVLFHTGLQKLTHGLYFQGEVLAFMVGQGDRFADLFALWLPADEIARLSSYDPLRTGAGPYRVDSLAFVLASNAVWVAELVLPVLLLIGRTRWAAWLGASLLVLVIQLGAREFGFAALFVNLLLLFTARGNERALPAMALAYGYVLCAVLGGWPGGGFFTVESL